jgi:hypothetical protein
VQLSGKQSDAGMAPDSSGVNQVNLPERLLDVVERPHAIDGENANPIDSPAADRGTNGDSAISAKLDRFHRDTPS